MSIVLYAVDENELAEAFDTLVCGELCEHLVHDGKLYYWRMTDLERADLRRRASRALAGSTMHEVSGAVLFAVVGRYKAEKQA
ncbi:hypothetical protein LCGC14_1768800 [marine sediment metagenome]|uniref:Uncharacterized protein n=1 Tax=marine sediment metagenome TaxID=412755 RepID=A0A0F9GYX1_9ZZZZ